MISHIVPHIKMKMYVLLCSSLLLTSFAICHCKTSWSIFFLWGGLWSALSSSLWPMGLSLCPVSTQQDIYHGLPGQVGASWGKRLGKQPAALWLWGSVTGWVMVLIITLHAHSFVSALRKPTKYLNKLLIFVSSVSVFRQLTTEMRWGNWLFAKNAKSNCDWDFFFLLFFSNVSKRRIILIAVLQTLF